VCILINQNNQSKRHNKRKDKKNEDKKNDSNDENDKKCIKCDRVSHSKNECSTINSEFSKCHKIDRWKQMCRIKKNQNVQFKSFCKDEKIVNESFITEEITLMIKRLIDEAESSLLVNLINDHITRKILDFEIFDHIFCNRSFFISYILKIFICEIDTRKKFTAKNT
jgi:hypothetical protein